MAKRRPFHIFTDPQTDAELLLPDLSDLEEQEFFWQKQAALAHERLQTAGEGDQPAAAAEITVAEAQLERFRALRSTRAVMLPHAALYHYEIIKPDWERWDEAVAASEQWNPDTGIVTRDKGKMRRDLFGEMVKVYKVVKHEDGSEEDEPVQKVPYQAVLWLWEKAYASMEINPARLDFLSQRFGNG